MKKYSLFLFFMLGFVTLSSHIKASGIEYFTVTSPVTSGSIIISNFNNPTPIGFRIVAYTEYADQINNLLFDCEMTVTLMYGKGSVLEEISTPYTIPAGSYSSTFLKTDFINLTGELPANRKGGQILIRYTYTLNNSGGQKVTKYTSSYPVPTDATRADPFYSLGITRISWSPLSAVEPVWYPSDDTPMLTSGQDAYSSTGDYVLTLQTDGNLVIYRTSNWEALWSSKSNGKGGRYLYFQGDGNLVLYKNANFTGVVWSSGKQVSGDPITIKNYTRFLFQSDGNLVMQFDGGTYIDIIGETQTYNRTSSHFGTL